MRYLLSVCLAGLLVSLPAAAAADPPAPLQPVDDWMVDYGDNRCTLSRAFGGGDLQIGLAAANALRTLIEVTVLLPRTSAPPANVTLGITVSRSSSISATEP